MQEANTHDIAVKVAVPVHYEGLNRRFRRVAKGRPQTDIRDAAAPLSFDQSAGHVHTVTGYDAVVWAQVGRGKTKLMTAFRAVFDARFHAVRPAQHAARQVYTATREQLANLARTNAARSEERRVGKECRTGWSTY